MVRRHRVPRPGELPDGQKLPAEGGVIFTAARRSCCGVYHSRHHPGTAMASIQRPAQTNAASRWRHRGRLAQRHRGGRKPARISPIGPADRAHVCSENIAKRVTVAFTWTMTQCRGDQQCGPNAYLKGFRRPGWSYNPANYPHARVRLPEDPGLRVIALRRKGWRATDESSQAIVGEGHSSRSVGADEQKALSKSSA